MNNFLLPRNKNQSKNKDEKMLLCKLGINIEKFEIIEINNKMSVQNVQETEKNIFKGQGVNMLDLRTIEKTRKLLREGRFSQREIAVQLGISRGSVNSIAKEAGLQRKQRRGPGTSVHAPESRNYRKNKVERCPHCGALVETPCLACQLRERMDIDKKIFQKWNAFENSFPVPFNDWNEICSS